MDIHRKLCSLYDDNIIKSTAVKQLFYEECTNIPDQQQSGWLSMFTDELVWKVSENQTFTVKDLSKCFPHISQAVMNESMTQKLKFYAQCVSILLTDDNKMKRIDWALL